MYMVAPAQHQSSAQQLDKAQWQGPNVRSHKPNGCGVSSYASSDVLVHAFHVISHHATEFITTAVSAITTLDALNKWLDISS